LTLRAGNTSPVGQRRAPAPGSNRRVVELGPFDKHALPGIGSPKVGMPGSPAECPTKRVLGSHRGAAQHPRRSHEDVSVTASGAQSSVTPERGGRGVSFQRIENTRAIIPNANNPAGMPHQGTCDGDGNGGNAEANEREVVGKKRNSLPNPTPCKLEPQGQHFVLDVIRGDSVLCHTSSVGCFARVEEYHTSRGLPGKKCNQTGADVI